MHFLIMLSFLLPLQNTEKSTSFAIMKTYLLNIPRRLKLFNNVLNAKTHLINKSWRVLNDDEVTESYFFKENGEIIISQNGMAQIGKYEILPIGKILVSVSEKNYILRPTVTEDKSILGFQLDGTEQYSLLLDEASALSNKIHTFSDFQNHLLTLENRKCLLDQENAEREKRNLEQTEKNEFYSHLKLGTIRSPYKELIILVASLFLAVLLSLIFLFKNMAGEPAFAYIIVGCVFFVVCLGVMWMLSPELSDKRVIKELLAGDSLSEKQRKWLEEYLRKM